MTKAEFEAKLQDVENAEELSKRLESATSAEELVAILAENGIEVTVEDVREWSKLEADGEFSEEDLENISGGLIGVKRPNVNWYHIFKRIFR